MLAHLPAVEPHGSEIVYCSEVQHIDRRASCLSVLPLISSFGKLEASAVPGHATVLAEVIKLCLPGAGDADRPRVNVAERVVSQMLGQIGKELPFTIKICSLAIHDCSGRDVHRRACECV